MFGWKIAVVQYAIVCEQTVHNKNLKMEVLVWQK